jgi:hypothetical protein
MGKTRIPLVIALLFFLASCAGVPLSVDGLGNLDRNSHYIFFTADDDFKDTGALMYFFTGGPGAPKLRPFTMAFTLPEDSLNVYICNLGSATTVSNFDIVALNDRQTSYNNRTGTITISHRNVYLPLSIFNESVVLEPGRITFLGNYELSNTVAADEGDSIGKIGAALNGFAGSVKSDNYHDFAYARRILADAYPFIPDSDLRDPYAGKQFQ